MSRSSKSTPQPADDSPRLYGRVRIGRDDRGAVTDASLTWTDAAPPSWSTPRTDKAARRGHRD